MSDPSDRRRHGRGEVAATVMVKAIGKWVGPYECENLSASGGLLFGPGHLGVGDQLTVELRLPGRAPVELDGTVRRANPRRSDQVAYGIAFLNVTADLEDLIQGAVLATLERCFARRPPSVLVVHDMELTRLALERDVRALGYEVVAAENVDEAIAWLEDASHDCSAIVIDGHGADPPARVELLERLLEERPGIRRLVISGMEDTLLTALGVVSGHAHAVLAQPWTLRDFSEALRGTPRAKSPPPL